MEIINKHLEEYYILANYLKTSFNKKKYAFIKSAYIHGSFARGEITPKESDLNIMIFTKNKEIKKKDIDTISKIKIEVNKKYNVKIEFKLNTLDKNNYNNVSTDLYYPYLYDFILNSFYIYGTRLEEDLLKILKTKTFFEFTFETTSVFSKIRIDFLENYFQDNKYRMYHNLYKYSRLLNQLKVDDTDIKEMLSKIKHYTEIDKDFILNQILKFEAILDKANLKEIYENNKSLKIILGYAKGGIIYNHKIKKILMLEDDINTCHFWSLPKINPTKIEPKSQIRNIKTEIETETGLTNIKIIERKIGECHNWFEKTENTFKKIYTEYYYATTDSEKIITPTDLHFKWIKIDEINDYISAPCLGYLVKVFYDDFIKQINQKK